MYAGRVVGSLAVQIKTPVYDMTAGYLSAYIEIGDQTFV
jgi:hypothetical protein